MIEVAVSQFGIVLQRRSEAMAVPRMRNRKISVISIFIVVILCVLVVYR